MEKGNLWRKEKMNSISLCKLKTEMEIEPEKLSLSLEAFIKDYTEKMEREGVILGLSGGLDSAVLLSLCRRAVGSKKMLALVMPEKDSKKEHTKDALHFAQELGIEAKLIDLTPYLKEMGIYKLFLFDKIPSWGGLKGSIVKKAYQFYEKKAGKSPFSDSLLGLKDKKYNLYLKKSNAYYRIKHRLRMALLYLYGELENKLVVGAAIKSEYKIGYFVKHGCDNATDIMPLLNLYKTQVRKLARYLNVPSKIIEKPPSPDIIPGITDEEFLGITYEKLDLILLALEKNWELNEIARVVEIEENKIIYIKDLIKKSEHMRNIYAPT
ncbi:MAG: NAD(+) synthase [Candidatus Caldatribacteriota bacterium]|nr:NAD(+) synthase [Candidatus Caldatribacteriota bacterium]